MTAPAMADKLGDVDSDEGVERFVDEVAHLIRSQAAGIFGNLLAVIPVVLAAQWLAKAAFGVPLVGTRQGRHVLDSLTLLGPTPLFAAFTGVLLFASSLIAGWVENWFVWHRLDSAIAWNPRIVARLGAGPRAALVGVLARQHLGLASNVSLGLMLGLVPADRVVLRPAARRAPRHARTGQLAAAVGALGLGIAATALVLVVRGRHRRDRRAQPGGQLLPRLSGRAALARHPPGRPEPHPPRDPSPPAAPPLSFLLPPRAAAAAIA